MSIRIKRFKGKIAKSIANAPEKVQTLLNEWDEEDNDDNSQTEGSYTYSA